MCGRYTFTADANTIAAEFDIADPPTYPVRYNIAPTQDVPVIRLRGPAATPEMAVVRVSESTGTRQLDVLRWGLIPHWAKDKKIAYSTINARCETVATQPAFRDAFRKRRCIVPASGFYEWRPAIEDGKEVKQPFYIRRKDGRQMALAGLWERWNSPSGEVIESFTIITTDANKMLRELHNRMPVMLAPEDYDVWLDPNASIEECKSLLRPCPPEWLEFGPVSRKVNSPRNDSADCIEPLA